MSEQRKKLDTTPLFRDSLTKEAMLDLVEEERRRAAMLLDEMCSPSVDIRVLEHYTRVIGLLCDAELRVSALVSRDVAETATHRLGDSSTALGVGKFVVERKLRLHETLQKIIDEENHFSADSLTEEQKVAKTRLQKCADNILTFETAVSLMNGAAELLLPDKDTRESLQALFFVALTFSPALREVACCRTHAHRMQAHTHSAPTRLTQNFFRFLPLLTKRYTDFDIDETKYVGCVRLLFRTGMTFEV